MPADHKVKRTVLIRPVAYFCAFTAMALLVASPALADQWIDIKTGKPVASFPVITDPNGPPGHKTDWVRPNIDDPNRAFDPRTGRNFARNECGDWIDIKSGQRVASFPVITDPNGPPGHKTDWVRPNIDDPNRAFDPRTGRNFAKVPCPSESQTATCPTPQPSTPKTATPEPQPTKTIGLVLPPPSDPTDAGLLAYHNKLRTDVGSPPLQWNPTLAEHATTYARNVADTGLPQHASRSGRETERENISLGIRGVSNPLQLAQVWGGEQRHFRAGVFPDVSTTGDWSDAGHYSQIVWSTTTDVGCGFASGKRVDALVCRYSPPGNQDGRPVLTPRVEIAAPCPDDANAAAERGR